MAHHQPGTQANGGHSVVLAILYVEESNANNTILYRGYTSFSALVVFPDSVFSHRKQATPVTPLHSHEP